MRQANEKEQDEKNIDKRNRVNRKNRFSIHSTDRSLHDFLVVIIPTSKTFVPIQCSLFLVLLVRSKISYPYL